MEESLTLPLNNSSTSVYNFYDIEKSFPDNYNNVIVAEGQRVIPIYVCKPICRYVEATTPVQKKPLPPVEGTTTTTVPTAEEEVLEELKKIDQMVIEIVKPPAKGNPSKHSRKTKLEPKEMVSDGFLRVKNSRIDLTPKKRKVEVVRGEETPSKIPKAVDKPQDENPSREPSESLIKETEPSEIVFNPSPPLATDRSEESPEREPQFACEKCDKRFYLKRAMLRHFYSHK